MTYEQTCYNAGIEYHKRCEKFDRFCCTGPIVKDEIMPANTRELARICSHAKMIAKEISERENIPWQDFVKYRK